jgi:hypothetical protein
MSYLTILRLLDVCMWIFVYILFLAIHTCCVKGWKVAHQIFVHKEHGFTIFIVFISCVICFSLHCFVLCCRFLVFYLFNSHLLFGFSFFFVFVNTSLQQSICIVFISRIVRFALSSCLLLSFFSLLDHFPHCCLGFRFFCFFKKNCNNPLEVIWKNVPLKTWQTIVETCSSYMFQNLCRF